MKDSLKRMYLLSYIKGSKALLSAGIFESKELAKEMLKVEFDFINEKTPIENKDYKIDEFVLNAIDN